jgi:probable DNA metabolism protein
MDPKEKEFNKRVFFARKHNHRNKNKIIQKVLEQKEIFGLDFVLNNLSVEARKLYFLSSEVRTYIHKAESFIRLKQFNGTLIGKAFFEFNVAESIARHFLRRFPNKRIIIIDENSNKAFVSEGSKIIKSNAKEFVALFNSIEESLSDRELEKLFGVFYDSQIIEERRNRNYALKMMPKKYWKNFNLREAKKIDRAIQENDLWNYS